MKPRPYLLNGTWWCSSGFVVGRGDTPGAAFISWLRESLSRYNCT